ncbi:hypothetical protein SRHO_G00225030 [Serrasalmus rhombeus]
MSKTEKTTKMEIQGFVEAATLRAVGPWTRWPLHAFTLFYVLQWTPEAKDMCYLLIPTRCIFSSALLRCLVAGGVLSQFRVRKTLREITCL